MLSSGPGDRLGGENTHTHITLWVLNRMDWFCVLVCVFVCFVFVCVCVCVYVGMLTKHYKREG